MTEPNQTLTFLSWVRERVAELADGRSQGRPRAAVDVTLAGAAPDGSPSGEATRSLPFLLAGPPDVAGLRRGAVVRRYPAPGTTDHESDRCPYVEFAQASLPWRYTPAPKPPAGTGSLHPWLVLLIGVEGTELTLADGQVLIEPAVQGGAHTLGNPAGNYRFAHVQVDAAGHRTARVLCGRRLTAGTAYLAVLVPAFDDAGNRRWTGQDPVTVPVYDHWRFATAVPPGSFEDLAAQLEPGASATVGRTPLAYPRLGTTAPALEVRGALVATGAPAETDLPEPVATDLANLLQLADRDEQGRPIVTLPRYGAAWDPAAAQPTWARTLNGDPRHRGVAGLGLEIGIRCQEELVADALSNLGALAEARQRLRHAVLGAEVTRALWRRRVPQDAQERLWLLGPALSRLTTTAGTVDQLATADDRALPAGVFSAAARRVLRTGPARTTLLRPRVAAAPILDAANRPPPAPPVSVDGVPLDSIGEAEFDRGRRQVVQAGRVNTSVLLATAGGLAQRTHPKLRGVASNIVLGLRRAVEETRPAPWGPALVLLAGGDAEAVGRFRNPERQATRMLTGLTRLNDRFVESADDVDLAEIVGQLSPSRAGDPAPTPVRLADLAEGVVAAFDPTAALPPVLDRVLDTIQGVDPARPTAPPEPCVGLDRAVWSDVERAFAEWLLPGVVDITDNAVVPLVTNPVFVDAFLAGLNTQLLAELRWRNIPVATGCTPLRRFWDRFDTAAGARVDDIVGVASWIAGSELGDSSHRPGGGSGRDLVVAVRGPLFLRYPATVVFLQTAVHDGRPDFDRDPPATAPRILPGFQGPLGVDIVFFGFPGFDPASARSHWLVFEEPPAGYRFANDSGTAATTGHEWASAALAQPVRVLIAGDQLLTVDDGDGDTDGDTDGDGGP
jgi:hypothetical protein